MFEESATPRLLGLSMEYNQFELIIQMRLKLTYFGIILPMFMIHCELLLVRLQVNGLR